MKIAFFGTPDFAGKILRKLAENSFFSISCVVTAMDKPAGRKKELTPPNVKIVANEMGLNLYQTESVKNDYKVDEIINDVDLCVVASFGQIIPKRLLDVKRFINVHASILPKYRGASPIQSAILNGDTETGVTIMDMDETLDTGDILSIKKTDITLDDTAETLFEKLSDMGADLLIETLQNIDTIVPKKQSETGIVPILTKKIKKEDGLIIPEITNVKKADCIIRGMYSWPIAYIDLDGKKLQIHKATIVPIEEEAEVNSQMKNQTEKEFYLKFKDGILRLDKVKLEGKNLMNGNQFINGYRK